MLITNSCALGQLIDTFKLDNKLSILNDRAYMFFPSTAKIEKSPVDINWMTNILLEYEEIKLTFHFEELFMIGDSNLYTQVLHGEKKIFPEKGYTNLLFYTLNSSNYDFKRKLLPNKEGLISILSTPQRYRTGDDQILINTLLVKTKDNSIFLAEVYVNQNGFKIKDQLTGLSEKVFQTLTNGMRTNNRNARVEYYKDKIFETNKYFTFSLPKDYVITTMDYGEKFEIHKYTNFIDSNWSSFSIYPVNPLTGIYDYGEELDLYGLNSLKDSMVRKEGRFLRVKVDWITYNSNSNKAFLKFENIDPNDIGIDGPYVHVFIATNSASSMEELTEILENIKLKRKLVLTKD